MPEKRRWIEFEGARGPDSQIRVGVWDRVCVPGEDEKDGQHTEFTVETLSQMVDNFLDRDGDPIPLDANHLSNYTHITGQPAPALAFYGALAVVWGGRIVRLERGRDTPPCPGSLYVSPSTATEAGIDTARDGLWCFRNEVTEIGQQLLKGFKLVSPTFLSEGTRRDGTPVGYCLAAVAATNTPWQSATEIMFEGDITATPDGSPPATVTMRIEQRGSEWVVLPESGDRVLGKHKTKADAEKQLAAIEASKAAAHESQPAGAVPAANKEASMAKFAKYAKFAGAAEGADDAAVMDGLGARLGKLAQEAMEDEAFKHEEEAAKLDEMAKAFEEDGDEKAKEMGRRMSRMSASFRKMAKFDADGDDDGDEAKKMEEEKAKMAKLEGEKAAEQAAYSAMQSTVDSLKARLSKFERAEAEREAQAAKEAEKRFEQLASEATAGGWKGDKAALIAFARTNFDSARSLVESFLPKRAPGHLFDRLSNAGAPAGHARDARSFEAPKTRTVKSPLGNFIEDDAAFAEKAREIAMSKDPAIAAKVDGLLAEAERPHMFNRLLVAQKIVRAEHPDLAETAE